MRLHSWLSVGLTLLAIFLIEQPANAGQATDRKVVMTFAQAYVDQQNSQTAIALLQEYLSRDSKYLEGWDYLAKIHLRQGQPEKAAMAYSQAAQNAPPEQSSSYKYQQASAEAQAGLVEKAKESLMGAARDPYISDSASSALATLRSGETLPEIVRGHPAVWKSTGSIKAGYDDNVLLFSDSVLATVRQTDAASAKIAPTVEIGTQKEIGLGQITSALNFAGQFYSSEPAKAYNSLSFAFSAGLIRPTVGVLGLQHSFDNVLKGSLTDGNSYQFYSWEDAITWKGERTLSGDQKIEWSGGVRYQNFRQTAAALSADNRSGLSVKPAVTWKSSFGATGFSLGTYFERLYAQGDNYKSDTFALPLNLQHNLFWEIKGNLNLSYTYIVYPNSSTNRKDAGLSGSITLSKAIAKNLGLGLEYGNTKNTSTSNGSNYNRQTLDLVVSGEWN